MKKDPQNWKLISCSGKKKGIANKNIVTVSPSSHLEGSGDSGRQQIRFLHGRAGGRAEGGQHVVHAEEGH